jgi:transcription elongation GreA/GreB family factor
MSGAKKAAEVVKGGWVKIRFSGDDEVEVFHIVDASEANVMENKIPDKNPFAQAVLGSKPGDMVSYATPHGTAKVEIVAAGQ